MTESARQHQRPQEPERLTRGLWVILATPFDPDGAVDHDSVERQVRLAQAVGAQGVVALGVFGEAAALDLTEQAAVVRTVTGVAERLPVVVGLAGRTTAVAVEQARAALDAARRPPSALMVQINAGAPAAVVEHLGRLHEQTGAGIVLQDYPLVSGVRMSPGDILRVLQECPYVVAVKAEAPPTPHVIAQLVAGTEVPVFGGLGGVGLVDELAAGAAGAMTGFSHPEGLRQTLDAFDRGGFAAAAEAWAPWLPLANFEGQAGIGLALRKQLLHRRGVLSAPTVRPPAAQAPAELGPLLDAHLKRVSDHELVEGPWTSG
jgi:4-hydroxy-tetrahydrodipicolinate synthase